MFLKICTNTRKNLVRSLLLWMAAAVVIFITVQCAMQGAYAKYDFKLGELIFDTDPRFVLEYNMYIQLVLNVPRSWLMLYAMPSFIVISTVLVLNRNHRDGFFEIEKSCGVKPSIYFFGRLTTLIIVNVIVSLFLLFMSFNWYYFTRGGVAEFASLWSYFGDSTVRLLRCYFLAVFPVILVNMGLTYMVGSLFKSGFAGAVAGFANVLITYICNIQLQFRMPELYSAFLNPLSTNQYSYWTFYDTEWFTEKQRHNPFTPEQTALWLGIMLGTAIFCFGVSYICTRRRKI